MKIRRNHSSDKSVDTLTRALRKGIIAALFGLLLSQLTGCGNKPMKLVDPPAGYEYAPCPEGMVFVGAAWFETPHPDELSENEESTPVTVAAFCIDRLPAQNVQGGPKKLVTYIEALQACKARGPDYSLVTDYQWERACRGNADNLYPYGPEYRGGKCPEAANAPVGENTGCVSDQGVLGMTEGAGEWTRGGDWAWRQLERSHRARAVVRGLGQGSERSCTSRLETWAEPNEEEKKAGKLAVIEDVSSSMLPDAGTQRRFASGSFTAAGAGTAVLDTGIVASIERPDFDKKENLAPAGPFSTARGKTRYIDIRQGYRCSKLALPRRVTK